MRHRSRRLRTHRCAAVLGAACLLASACSDDDGGGNSATPEIVIDGAAAGAADEPGTADAGDEAAAASEDTEASGAELTDEELALEFAQCMRDEGIDWPDPTTNADGSIDLFGGNGPGAATGEQDGPDESTRAAFEVCGPLVQGASFLPGGGDGLDVETQDSFVEFAQCLRDEGIDAQDPDFDALGAERGGPGAIFGAGFDPDDPATQDAIDACETVLIAAGIEPGAGRPGG